MEMICDYFLPLDSRVIHHPHRRIIDTADRPQFQLQEDSVLTIPIVMAKLRLVQVSLKLQEHKKNILSCATCVITSFFTILVYPFVANSKFFYLKN